MQQSAPIPDQPDTSSWWRSEEAPFSAVLFLSPETIAAAPALPLRLGRFRIEAVMLDPGLNVPGDHLRSADLVIMEVRDEQAGALDRLYKALAQAEDRPLVAAVRQPSLDQVRTMMRAGVADVLPLPLGLTELRHLLDLLAARVGARKAQAPSGRVVTFIKSKGGIGGTTVATQVSAAAARGDADRTALLDFDVQLGCAALYLGLIPQLTLSDAMSATERLDGAALRTAMTRHPSGLHVLAAPPETMPLESLSVDQALAIVNVAAREFDTVFVDSPLDWTDWSMSVMARSDELVMLTDLSLAGLHNGRRRLDLLRQQGLGDIPLRLVVTRVEKRRFRTLSFGDAESALGRSVDFAIAQDDLSVTDALTQGRLLSDLYPGARVTREYQDLAAMLARAAGKEST